jgi:hypothetical protein
VLDTLESIQARSPGFKAVAPETKLPRYDLVETVKALNSPVREVEVTENVKTVPPSDLKVLKTPELKVVTQETNVPPHDLVETGEAVKPIEGIKAVPSSELKAVAPETKSTPAQLVETKKAVVSIEGIATVALETKLPPTDLVDTVKAVKNIEGIKPPADLVETIESVDYSLSDVLPDDDVSIEFSRVAAKQTPSIDPVLLIYPFVGGTAVENAAAGLLFGEEIIKVSEKRLLMIQRKNCHPKARYMTIRNRDIESLQPGNFVNDIIVDFWSVWIMRKEVQSESVVYPMTTYETVYICSC